MTGLARGILFLGIGFVLSALGATYKTIEFWAVVLAVVAIERIVWIEFAEALRDVLGQQALDRIKHKDSND